MTSTGSPNPHHPRRIRLGVFCGASRGQDPQFVQAARATGRLIATRGIGLVYGGARIGLMGELADAALAAGGEVTGVIPRALCVTEVVHPGLSRLEVVADMHARKERMGHLADGFLALPGGLGTLEELMEVWSWAHLALHTRPFAVLDVGGFYRPLLAFVKTAADAGFVTNHPHPRLLAHNDPRHVIDSLVERIGDTTVSVDGFPAHRLSTPA